MSAPVPTLGCCDQLDHSWWSNTACSAPLLHTITNAVHFTLAACSCNLSQLQVQVWGPAESRITWYVRETLWCEVRKIRPHVLHCGNNPSTLCPANEDANDCSKPERCWCAECERNQGLLEMTVCNNFFLISLIIKSYLSYWLIYKAFAFRFLDYFGSHPLLHKYMLYNSILLGNY